MNVTLLTSPASFKDMEKFAAIAALTCRANTDKEYVPHEVLGRIIKAGHESVLEHITLTYSVKEISRACLQELARHRHISLSVESTRHTLKEFLSNQKGMALMIGSSIMPNAMVIAQLLNIYENNPDMSNDELKYYLPEFWPTNLVMTVNIRELRHIIKLRSAPAALDEFRVLARELFNAVPEEFRYLLQDCVYKEAKE